MTMMNPDSRDDVADQDTTGRTVVGMFTNRPDAEAAIRELKAAGFADDQIGVALQNEQGELRELSGTTGHEAAEGVAKGAVSGGLVGGLIGLLGSLLVPGVGPIVVGGVLASTLTGAGIGAATGGIIGALVTLGVPEADARHFDEGLRSGRTLVAVGAGARTREALVILDRHGMDFGPSGASRYSSGIKATGEPVRERGRYGGKERRTTRESTYAGPERRLAGV
jgi:Heat induced stress protein YflT